jgi:hypothetical protein
VSTLRTGQPGSQGAFPGLRLCHPAWCAFLLVQWAHSKGLCGIAQVVEHLPSKSKPQ